MILPVLALFASSGPPALETVQPNDNRHSAGTLKDGVLTVVLEARAGAWQPEGEGGRALEVAAFAEEGGPLQTPGPLIRVPLGTEVRATIRNRLGRKLGFIGFGKRVRDSLIIPAGEARDIQFTAGASGTYFYAARSGVDPMLGTPGEDTQLHGVMVVDPAGTVAPDRIMALSWYIKVDMESPSGIGHGTMTINGLSWPHTEHLEYAQGDSVRWRVVNLSDLDHPMHLHGFYFRVDARGDGFTDTLFTPAQRRMAVTEVLLPFRTMTIAWQAARPGNWIFHCHYAFHLSPAVALDTEKGEYNGSTLAHHPSDRPHQMYGLVMGMSVSPRGAQPLPGPVARTIRLVQREKAGVYGAQRGMSYSMDQDPAALSIPAPTLVLERGKRVQVTIVNESSTPGSVHWHGIELESYPDGVPGWSGSASRTLPAIGPHDSLTVSWTPPRAGSFMYHSHFDEAEQMGSGLYGPIIVLEPGEKYDPETDRVLFFSNAGSVHNVIKGPYPAYLMNGEAQPGPMTLKSGTKYRFRLLNLAGDLPTLVALNQGGKPVEWRAVAKDGYPLPANQATVRPAVLVFEPGEIYDFEFTPGVPGELTLRFGMPGTPPPPPPELPRVVTVPVHVQ